MNHNDHDDTWPRQRFTITIDIPGCIGTDTSPVAALLNVLNHLEHDGIRPYRTTLEITEPPTP